MLRYLSWFAPEKDTFPTLEHQLFPFNNTISISWETHFWFMAQYLTRIAHWVLAITILYHRKLPFILIVLCICFLHSCIDFIEYIGWYKVYTRIWFVAIKSSIILYAIYVYRSNSFQLWVSDLFNNKS